jgi:hypothetical protein
LTRDRSGRIALTLVVLCAGCPRDVYLPGRLDDLHLDGAREGLDRGDRADRVDLRGGADVIWAMAPLGSVSGRTIAVSGTGQGVIAGSYSGKAAFGGHELYHPTSPLRPRAFVAALDAQGTFLWARGVEGDGESGAAAVVLDGAGGITIAGQHAGSATFGGLALSATGELFVAKLDPAGTVLWATSVGSAGGQGQIRGLAVDAEGNAHVTGSFAGTASFGATSLTSQGSFDVFVAKLDAQGSVLWASATGGAEADHGMGIGVDASGGSTVVAQTAPGGGQSGNLRVIRVSPSGATDWTAASDGTTGGSIEALAIAVDAAGNSVITGAVRGPVQLGGVLLDVQQGKFKESVFVAKLDPEGSFLWATAGGGAVGSSGYDESRIRGLAIALDGGGAATVTGRFF